MKRDMEVVRSLLLRIEAEEDHLFNLHELIEMSGLGSNGGVGLVMMLKSGGYLETTPRGNSYRMAWTGYEFLDSIRDPEIWSKTKAGASKVGSWSVKLLADLATGFIRVKAHELGLPIGPS